MSVDTTDAPAVEVSSEAGDEARHTSEQVLGWCWVANATLGIWLATGTATFAPHSPALLWSDVISGVSIALLSAIAGVTRFGWVRWAVASIGLWLMVAPLVFWAPTAAAYATDTLVGALVFTFAVLIPGVRDLPGPSLPPGWTYNPSAWPQRAGIIALALIQFFAARYMAAHQLGHVPHAWDPVFGDGTYRVLNSDVSKAFPVSDAGLGAFTYLIEALTGFLGGPRRWRTAPWAVLLFGVLVVPVGIVSVVLVILQPLAVGAWCGLCLFTAIATVFMISPAVDELVATGQFLSRSRRAGRPFWQTLWRGGTDLPSREARPSERKSLARELADGMELSLIPWNLAAVAVLGGWLMVSPVTLGGTGPAAASDQLVGALVITFAVIGFGEAARATRWICLPLGAWLLIAPWVLSDQASPARWNDLLVGGAIILLSLRRGPVEGRFGSWDRYVV